MSLKFRASRRALRHRLASGGAIALLPLGIGIGNLVGIINPGNVQSAFWAWVCTASIPFIVYWMARWTFGSIISFDQTYVRWVTLDARWRRMPIRRIKNVQVVEGPRGLLLLIDAEGRPEISVPIEANVGANSVESEVRAYIDEVSNPRDC